MAANPSWTRLQKRLAGLHVPAHLCAKLGTDRWTEDDLRLLVQGKEWGWLGRREFAKRYTLGVDEEGIVYVHEWFFDDIGLHNHIWHNVSYTLAGEARETTREGIVRSLVPGVIQARRDTEYHTIHIVKPMWSVFTVSRTTTNENQGFIINGKEVPAAVVVQNWDYFFGDASK